MGKPKMLLLKDVGTAVRYLASMGSYVDTLDADDSDVSKDSAAAIRDSAAEGLAALTAALEAGADPSEAVTFPGQNDEGEEVEQEITLEALQPFLEETLQKADARVTLLSLEQAAMRGHSYAEDGDDLNPDLAGIAVDTGNELVSLVAKSKAAGVPGERALEFWGNRYTLDELRELGGYLVETGQKISGQVDEARAAADAPYLAALSGDRKKVFQAEFAGLSGMWQCLGAHGEELDTPEKLAASPVWYVYGNSGTDLLDVWRIRGWRFDGDAITEHLADQGIGARPPEAAFQP